VTNDNCPAPGTPFSAENLGHACEAAGLTWRAYSENLAVAGGIACSYDGNTSTGLYTRKHDPWTCFVNLDHSRERPYADLAADIAGGTLPNLVFVIPNNCHNTHNSSTPGCGVANGDAWLAANLPAIRGALGPKGLLILTWDEDDNSASNHILTVFDGPLVVPGAVSTRTITHYTVGAHHLRRARAHAIRWRSDRDAHRRRLAQRDHRRAQSQLGADQADLPVIA
jgi:acid phosphatase